MTNSKAKAASAPVPAPPVKPKPVASREELVKLLTARESSFTVTVK